MRALWMRALWMRALWMNLGRQPCCTRQWAGDGLPGLGQGASCQVQDEIAQAVAFLFGFQGLPEAATHDCYPDCGDLV
jgi:hypothetical protein